MRTLLAYVTEKVHSARWRPPVSIRVHVVHELDLDTLARVLMASPPHRASTRAVRRAVTAILADAGVDGALRLYRRIRAAAVADGTADEHLRLLAGYGDQVAAAYPPAAPRPRPARPRPDGRPLIDVLTEAA